MFALDPIFLIVRLAFSVNHGIAFFAKKMNAQRTFKIFVCKKDVCI